MNDYKFATEIISELKANSKRWFVAFIVVLSFWLATIVGFLWYISLPTEEYDIEQTADNDSYNQVVGGDYNGGEAESQVQTPSNTK